MAAGGGESPGSVIKTDPKLLLLELFCCAEEEEEALFSKEELAEYCELWSPSILMASSLLLFLVLLPLREVILWWKGQKPVRWQGLPLEFTTPHIFGLTIVEIVMPFAEAEGALLLVLLLEEEDLSLFCCGDL